MKLLNNIVLIFLLLSCASQKRVEKDHAGVYSGEKGLSHYELTLKPDNTYLLNVKTQPFDLYSSGNWLISKNGIILNSVSDDHAPNDPNLPIRRNNDFILYKNKILAVKGSSIILQQDSLLNISGGKVILKKKQ